MHGLVLALVCCWLSTGPTPAAFQIEDGAQWNPVQGPPAGSKYVGQEVCAGCHASEARTYKKAPMAEAGALAVEAGILREHPRLSFQQGRYRYRILRNGDEFLYSVSDGKQTLTAPVLWAFGKGEAGQTYVFRHDGAYYQSRASFFNDSQGLGLTLGAPLQVPANLADAFGERLNVNDARLCFACHTTAAVVGGEFAPEKAVPGVGCEACHGPGARHVAAIQQGGSAGATIFNPGRLAANDLDDFCGECHRTWAQVQLMNIRDIRNVRFQPYRLEKSRCWGTADPRISCLGCHDPHSTVVRNVSLYDSKCLACHWQKGGRSDSRHLGAACSVSTRDCVACHMPKYSLPHGHFKFTDHYIRVVRPGAPYPG